MHRGSKTLSLHLTDLCNNKCIFCVVGIPELTGELDPHAVQRVAQAVRRGAGQGYEVVNIHGGEPTVAPHLMETLELIRACGYPRVYMQTNGRRLKSRAFTQRLRELNVELFIVSVHGRTAATHDLLSGARGAFDDMLAGIANAREAGAIVESNTVVARQNLHELPDLVEMLVERGVEHLNFSNLHPAGSAWGSFDAVTPGVDEMRPWLVSAIERARARGAALSLEGFAYCMLPSAEALHVRRRDGVVSVEIRGHWLEDYETFMDETQRVKGLGCKECVHESVCPGVYSAYIEKRGWGELRPVPAARAAGPSSAA